MYNIIFWFVAFAACVIGRICGLGGGVIIKPVLDSFGVMSVASVSFLSACTVLCMTGWSVGKAFVKKDVELDIRISTALAMGSLFGGLIGKRLFALISAAAANPDTVGSVQAAVLVVMLLISMAFTLKRDQIQTHHIQSLPLSAFIGACLGLVSAFIGGGSGPINMVCLAFLFSMPTKAAAVVSLYIILPAQAASIAQTLLTHSVPEFSVFAMASMVVGAIAGSEVGRKINKHISEETVNRCFKVLIAALILLNVYNFIQYIA